jgi:gas vesicle protein
MNRMKSIALGILTGAAAAWGGVLLSTPYSGKELRLQLRKAKIKSKDTLFDLKNRTTEVKEQFQHTTETSNAIVKNVAHDLSQSIEQWKQTTLPHQQAIQFHLEEIQHSLTTLEQQVTHTQDKKE